MEETKFVSLGLLLLLEDARQQGFERGKNDFIGCRLERVIQLRSDGDRKMHFWLLGKATFCRRLRASHKRGGRLQGRAKGGSATNKKREKRIIFATCFSLMYFTFANSLYALPTTATKHSLTMEGEKGGGKTRSFTAYQSVFYSTVSTWTFCLSG